VDKSKLLSKRKPFAEAEVPVEGGKVRVRSLSRDEILIVRGLGNDPGKFERKLLSFAMVDPTLTEAEVRAWQQNSDPMEIEDVTDMVMEISGLKERADKAAYKSAGD
jgi:hypothetical protein